METVVQDKGVEPRKVRARKSRKQPQLDLSNFERCSFMYVQIGAVVLWNNAAAMRKNGICPEEVALKLHEDFGVHLEGNRRKRKRRNPVQNRTAFEYFAMLTAPCGSPSILDECGGRA
jgi:hypothetical protein